MSKRKKKQKKARPVPPVSHGISISFTPGVPPAEIAATVRRVLEEEDRRIFSGGATRIP
jgi:hypothetical protein